MPPPGLSDPTVLMGTFFGLLRLLQPALAAARAPGAGPLAAFPAAGLFGAAGGAAAAEAEPVFDAPRLGIVSHLAREHLLSQLQQQPVTVAAPHLPRGAGGSSSGGAAAGASAAAAADAPHGPAAEQQCGAAVQQQQAQQASPLQQAASGCAAPPALADAWVPELLNACLLLYCWRVGFNYKMMHSLSSSVASSLHTLDELDRIIAPYTDGGG